MGPNPIPSCQLRARYNPIPMGTIPNGLVGPRLGTPFGGEIHSGRGSAGSSHMSISLGNPPRWPPYIYGSRRAFYYRFLPIFRTFLGDLVGRFVVLEFYSHDYLSTRLFFFQNSTSRGITSSEVKNFSSWVRFFYSRGGWRLVGGSFWSFSTNTGTCRVNNWNLAR